jgi:DNA-binding SARP family transcriptional activator
MLVLHTLGGLSVEGSAAAEGYLQRPRVLSLLVLLAGSGPGGIVRDGVLALLWPESDTCRARASLKQLAFQARRLGDLPIVLGDGGLVRLDAARVRVDLWTFESAARRGDRRAAANAYTGPFADGFVAPPELDELGRWVERRRAAVRQRCVSVLSALCGEAAAAGDVEALVGYRRRLAELDPLSSRAALALMQVLVGAGDRPAALAVARAHARLVRAELDAEPDPTIVRFERELRRLSDAELPIDLVPLGAPAPDPTVARGRRTIAQPPDGRYWLTGD